MKISELLDRLISLFFPPRCVICQKVVDYDDVVCRSCTYDIETDDVDAKLMPSGAVGGVALMAYDKAAQDALVSYKLNGSGRGTEFYCEKIYGLIIDKWYGIRIDVVVPVPMSKKSRRERGFNHAELLARGMSRLLDAELEADALVRREGSLPQHSLGREKRISNALNSYTLGNTFGVKGKKVLLVDDILTTGATACACVRLLLEAGAADVYVAAVASQGLSGTP